MRKRKKTRTKVPVFSLSLFYFLSFSILAWAAASFAIGTLYGEQET